MFNQSSAGSILQGICLKSWRFKETLCRKEKKKIPSKEKNKPLRNPSGSRSRGSYQDRTRIRHQWLQDPSITPQMEFEHVICIRVQTTFSPLPGLVHTVAQTWLSYWPHADMAKAIHHKDSLATHLIYMPCFMRLGFEPSNLQRQGCWQHNGKSIA